MVKLSVFNSVRPSWYPYNVEPVVFSTCFPTCFPPFPHVCWISHTEIRAVFKPSAGRGGEERERLDRREETDVQGAPFPLQDEIFHPAWMYIYMYPYR